MSDFRAQHPIPVGVVEMAIGATLLHYGVAIGQIDVGRHVVGSAVNVDAIGAVAGGATGAAAGLLGAKIIGGIGIAAMGGAVSVPAAILVGGGSLIFSLAGYAAGDIYEHLTGPDPADLLMAGAALPVGLWFLIRGCRRVIGAVAVADVGAKAGDGFVKLSSFSGDIEARSLDELKAFARRNGDIGFGAAATVIAGSAGAAVGASAAAGSVTILGSKTLGGVALAAGLVSAPVWPVTVAATTTAGLVGLVAWKIIRKRRAGRPPA